MATEIDGIKDRIARAEYAAVHICNNSSVWFKYYEDRAGDNRFIQDFQFLIKENERLAERIVGLEYKLESLGASAEA